MLSLPVHIKKIFLYWGFYVDFTVDEISLICYNYYVLLYSFEDRCAFCSVVIAYILAYNVANIMKMKREVLIMQGAYENKLTSIDRSFGNIEALISAIKEEIRCDINAVKTRDPAAKSTVEILLLYSGLHAILAYRVAHKLYLSKHYFSARAISQIARFFTGIEIHPGAVIGKGLFIDHGMGVVIGETSVIGDNCTIYQGVTLGGTGKDLGKRHPTIGDNVLLGAGAKVLGPITIEDNCKVAANAVVLKEIPLNSTAVGIPAKVVRRHGRRVDDLDQVNIPDPVANEIAELRQKLDSLTLELEELRAKQKKTRSPKTTNE